jgi:membrane-associated phospholipid phosphatase
MTSSSTTALDPHAEAVPLAHDPRRGVGRLGLRDFPLRRSDAGWFVGAYVVFCAVGVAVGELITHQLRHSWLQRTDISIERWLAERRTPWLDTATFVGSELADTIVKISVTVVVALVMLAVWRRWLELLMVALALVLEASAFITITWIVGRPRPDVPRLETSPVGSSFPSGHVAAAVVYGGIVVVVFWHTRTRWIRVLAVTVVALVAAAAGFSRMYRGMHHLSDIVAGILLGLAAVFVTRAILLRTVTGDRAPRADGSVEAISCS